MLYLTAKEQKHAWLATPRLFLLLYRFREATTILINTHRVRFNAAYKKANDRLVNRAG